MYISIIHFAKYDRCKITSIRLKKKKVTGSFIYKYQTVVHNRGHYTLYCVIARFFFLILIRFFVCNAYNVSKRVVFYFTFYSQLVADDK